MTMRILIVDDDADLIEGLRWYLEAEGFQVIAASDGEAAIETFRKERPDLVILDIMMPKMDGYETCKRLKSDDATRGIPVILLSAKGRNVDQKMGFEVGADDYITKPFSPRKLVERINVILNQQGDLPKEEAV